jgi:hypothetical protein
MVVADNTPAVAERADGILAADSIALETVQ